MKTFLFKGGIHPYDGKELSKDKPIKWVYPKGELVYPLSQHIGAPSVPVVKKGDCVLIGQKIAEAGGFVSAPIYSTVSGKVKAIEPRLTVTGAMINSIVIENDFNYSEVEWPKRKPLEEMTREEKLEIIKEAGVVGMGGAGFPTHVKLSPKEP
ncbi:MAG: electron transporter RnfC, partial [Clostridiaceae bacterium]